MSLPTLCGNFPFLIVGLKIDDALACKCDTGSRTVNLLERIHFGERNLAGNCRSVHNIKATIYEPFRCHGRIHKIWLFFSRLFRNRRIITKLMMRNAQFYPAFCIFNYFFILFFFANLYSIWCYREYPNLMAVWYIVPIRTTVASQPLKFQRKSVLAQNREQKWFPRHLQGECNSRRKYIT